MSALIKYEEVNLDRFFEKKSRIDTIFFENNFIVVPLVESFSSKPLYTEEIYFLMAPDIATDKGYDTKYIERELGANQLDSLLGKEKIPDTEGEIPIYLPYVTVTTNSKAKHIFFRNTQKAIEFINALEKEIPDFHQNQEKYVTIA